MTSRNGRRGRERERCVNSPVGRGRYETMSRRGSECATAGAARVRRVGSTLTGARRSAKASVDIGCEPLVYRQNLLLPADATGISFLVLISRTRLGKSRTSPTVFRKLPSRPRGSRGDFFCFRARPTPSRAPPARSQYRAAPRARGGRPEGRCPTGCRPAVVHG